MSSYPAFKGKFTFRFSTNLLIIQHFIMEIVSLMGTEIDHKQQCFRVLIHMEKCLAEFKGTEKQSHTAQVTKSWRNFKLDCSSSWYQTLMKKSHQLFTFALNTLVKYVVSAGRYLRHLEKICNFTNLMVFCLVIFYNGLRYSWTSCPLPLANLNVAPSAVPKQLFAGCQ